MIGPKTKVAQNYLKRIFVQKSPIFDETLCMLANLWRREEGENLRSEFVAVCAFATQLLL